MSLHVLIENTPSLFSIPPSSFLSWLLSPFPFTLIVLQDLNLNSHDLRKGVEICSFDFVARGEEALILEAP